MIIPATLFACIVKKSAKNATPKAI